MRHDKLVAWLRSLPHEMHQTSSWFRMYLYRVINADTRQGAWGRSIDPWWWATAIEKKLADEVTKQLTQ